MKSLDGQAAGCTGRPLLHLAYSIARTAGLNPARAILYALTQTRYLTAAAAAAKTRGDVARTLTATAAAAAARLARPREGARR